MSVVSKRRRTSYGGGSSTSRAMQVAARLLGDPSVRSAVRSVVSSGRSRIMDWVGRTTPTNQKYDSEPSNRKLPYKKLTPCRPKLKVSKKFKAKVQAVESAGTPKGIATFRYMGCVYVTGDQNAQAIVEDITTGSAGTTLLTSSSAGNPSLNNTLQWHTPVTVLHWASVLFNGKVNDIYDGSTVTNFNNENLVLEIPYMSTHMSLHNPTMQVIELDFYMCVPKISTNTNAIDEWANLAANQASNVSGQTPYWYGAEPGQLTSFSKKWSYKKKTWMLKPGQSVSHFEKQGPLCYTYSKFINGTSNWTFPKGVGISCFFVTKFPQLLVNDSKIAGHSTKANSASNYRTVSIEVTHKYVIEAPEISDDSQKFDKFITNSYNGAGGVIGVQTQTGSAGDTVKDVYYKDPGLGLVSVL